MTPHTLVSSFPAAAWAVPNSTTSAGRYLLRFARTEEELDRILRLRYEVFNLELNAGLDRAHADGRDEDEFDRRFHHLLIEERESRAVVGTYRMQTGAMAAKSGWYSDGLFQVDSLPEAIRTQAVELGRGCLAAPHRNRRVLDLLWRGLASYLTWNHKTVVFGCCSLNSQDQSYGLSVHRHLEKQGSMHKTLRVSPRPDAACEPDSDARFPTPKIPALFQSYLTLGARILGPPAIDREFKTIDWLLLLNVEELDKLTYRTFFR